jgi:hemerythrin
MVGAGWDESLDTGNELIDRQHRELIRFVEELSGAEVESNDEVLRVLDKVMDFTLYHFHAEEDLMTQVGYPASAAQDMVDQHQEFKAYARLRVLEFRQGEMVSVLPLQRFIEQFLKIHEFGMDRLLADWIRAQNGNAKQ